MQPRAQYSIHPSLARVTAVATTGGPVDEAQLRTVPYPTPAQYAKVEAAYRRGGLGGASPSVPRQPPSMLAALQRPDLTQPARQKMLAAMAPRNPLVRRNKFVFSSDARREKFSPITHDFSVDVTPELLTSRVHGFELIGHSLPAAEWTLPAYETRLPWRYGWSPAPGKRCLWIGVAGQRPSAPTSAAAAAAPLPPPPSYLVAELPLPSNPITHVWLAPDRPWLHVRCLRRVGSALASLLPEVGGEATPDDAFLELANLDHIFPGLPLRIPLTRANLVDVVVPQYVAATEPPQPEGPMGAKGQPQEQAPVLFEPPPMDDPYVLTVAISPVGTTSLGPSFSAADYPVNIASSPQGSLGRLVFRPSETAAQLAKAVSRQLDLLLAHRRFMEQQQPSPTAFPLTGVSLHWVDSVASTQRTSDYRGTAAPQSFRFRLDATWGLGPEHGGLRTGAAFPFASGKREEPPPCPITSIGTERGGTAWASAMPTMPSLGAVPDAILSLEADRLSLIASSPPFFDYPELQPKATTLSNGSAASADTYFRALQVPALAILFIPRGGPDNADQSKWQIPIRTGSGTTGGIFPITLPSGEYTGEALAAAITAAARRVTQLAPLRLRATFIRGVGFGFSSDVGSVFSIPWQTEDPQYVDPQRLGYRTFDETGLSAYLPHGDQADAALSAFPSTELGLGVPSPPPLVPTVVSIELSQRAQLVFQAKPTERVVRGSETTRPEAPLGLAEGAAAALNPLQLTTQRAALYHHLQPLRVVIRVPQTVLLFGSASAYAPLSSYSSSLQPLSSSAAGNWGSSEQAFLSADALQSAATQLAGGAGSPLSADAAFAALALFAAVHDPTSVSAPVLFDALVRLLGELGRTYGTLPTKPAQPPMDADGPYRTVLALSNPEALPAVDALLDKVADGVRLRQVVSDLSRLLANIIRGPVLQGVPLHVLAGASGVSSIAALGQVNGAVASSGIALLLGRVSEQTPIGAAASGAPTSSKAEVLKSLLALYVQASGGVLQLPQPGDVVFPGYPYLGNAVAAGTLPAANVVSPLPGIFVVLPVVSVGDAADPRVRILEGGFDYEVEVADRSATSASPLQAYTGSTVVLTHPPSLTPATTQPGVAAGQIISWFALTSDAIAVVLAHNLPEGSAVPFVWNGGSVTTNILVADSPLTTVTKMLLIAGNYAASLDAVYTELPTPAEQQDDVSVRICNAVGTGAALSLGVPAHLLLVEAVQIALRSQPVTQTDPETAQTTTVAASVTLSRLNEHPFSADWASVLPERIRPERLGFVNGEWGALTSAASNRWARAASAMSFRTASTITLSPRVALAPPALVAPFSVDRSPPPYLLLDIELNDDRREGPLPPGSMPLQGGLGELSSLARIVQPQITRCVAYVPVGSDGYTLRLLDRQDDRSPVFFPTGVTVGRVRFRVLRPDGTPYNVGGRKIMFALRFFSRDELPDAFALPFAKQEH